MTDKELNIAICKARGWKPLGEVQIYDGDDCGYEDAPKPIGMMRQWILHEDGFTVLEYELPDHINGIEALGHMHEAEKTLTDDQWDIYEDNLIRDVNDGTTRIARTRLWVSASACQRAKCFAKTLNIYV